MRCAIPSSSTCATRRPGSANCCWRTCWRRRGAVLSRRTSPSRNTRDSSPAIISACFPALNTAAAATGCNAVPNTACWATPVIRSMPFIGRRMGSDPTTTWSNSNFPPGSNNKSPLRRASCSRPPTSTRSQATWLSITINGARCPEFPHPVSACESGKLKNPMSCSATTANGLLAAARCFWPADSRIR